MKNIPVLWKHQVSNVISQEIGSADIKSTYSLNQGDTVCIGYDSENDPFVYGIEEFVPVMHRYKRAIIGFVQCKSPVKNEDTVLIYQDKSGTIFVNPVWEFFDGNHHRVSAD